MFESPCPTLPSFNTLSKSFSDPHYRLVAQPPETPTPSMKYLAICSSILLAQLAKAHFDITYPATRGDSFLPPASQWLYPCAGINATTNRTMWPTTGGSLVLDLHHPFTYIWVNLGLGEEVASFNVSLTPNLPYNETGNGTLCLPHVALPEEANVTEGAVGSLQVITVGDSGSALYNCADLMFTSNATLLTAGEGECVNSTGVSITRVEQQTDDSAATTTTTEASTTASSASATAEAADAESSANTITSSYWSEILVTSLVIAGIVGLDVIV
ncbi:hypothetical protein KC363_g716 [Hortaea werneckii]|uniref:Copper acquisition factor BIM1-like domain-containing protein n=1 Tax=Hortaea werneckii TaxID=91943 RepID=A0A3M7G5Z8_HORWE|nr:hypothetical protein KC361_g3508 [Hortaea werneckii]KAI7196758.1 hypothetical protein KC363_g716 [Hortaea werneckii]KAI7511635.1 hypothetical protein KC347_g3176 [Hortaea werneckii]RMY96592.1 hypothetical protein D0861_00044 [Hortaea werneckii]